MAEVSTGFMALPDGIGTFEHICEILTAAQRGLHSKTCGILNLQGFFDSSSKT
jgi:predicted Rossmann-fold nucleotide-binding protein